MTSQAGAEGHRQDSIQGQVKSTATILKPDLRKDGLDIVGTRPQHFFSGDTAILVNSTVIVSGPHLRKDGLDFVGTRPEHLFPRKVRSTEC